MISEQKRKSSLTITDIETMRDLDSQNHDYSQTEKEEDFISEIFEDICEDAEVEDEMELCRNRVAARRSSMSGIGNFFSDDIAATVAIRRRRHSTFNPRDRKSHRNAREEVKEHILSVQDESHAQRRISVNSLMDFNLSLEVAMAASIQDMSSTLKISCPVLSYMNVNEDLLDDKVKSKRPSLISVSESDASERFEAASITEIECDAPHSKAEYTVELPYSEEIGNIKEKPRKRHSYKMLERRLSIESPITVIKGLKLCEKKCSNQRSECVVTKSQNSKAQGDYVPDAVQGPSVQQVPDKRQYACGA